MSYDSFAHYPLIGDIVESLPIFDAVKPSIDNEGLSLMCSPFTLLCSSGRTPTEWIEALAGVALKKYRSSCRVREIDDQVLEEFSSLEDRQRVFDDPATETENDRAMLAIAMMLRFKPNTDRLPGAFASIVWTIERALIVFLAEARLVRSSVDGLAFSCA